MNRKLYSLKTLLTSFFLFTLLTCEFNVYGQSVLYGMTQNGGMHSKGVPYQIMPDGTSFYSFHDFEGTDAAHPGDGAMFTQIAERPVVQGKYHELSWQGYYIGLTQSGKYNSGLDFGSLVRLKNDLGGLTALHSMFRVTSATGTRPTGGLLEFQGARFYGLMSQGGLFNSGTLFYMSTERNLGEIVVLASFDVANTGRSPMGTPIIGRDGKLYGITEFGGTYDQGVIFSYDIVSRIPQYLVKLVDFDGAEKGANPTGSLVLASNGRLYGTTKNGGLFANGVVFSVLPDGSDFVKLIDLNGVATGSNPKGALTQFTDGYLYGMTSSGGAHGYGTIFRISESGAFTKIHDFDGSNGKSPVGDLLTDSSGERMYGTTYSGGVNDEGVLFKLENGIHFSKLYDYKAATGSNPVGRLVMPRKQFTLKIDAIDNAVVYADPFSPIVHTLNDQPVYFASSDTAVVAVQENKLVFKSPGNSMITAYQLGDHKSIGAWSNFSVSVKKASQSINFEPLPAKTFGDSPFVISASSSSGLPVSFSSSNTSIATVSGNSITIRGAGHVTITAYQSGNAHYEAATPVAQHLFIDRADQTILFNPPPVRICCQFFDLVASSSAGQTVRFKSEEQLKLQISGSTITPNDIGKFEIIAYHPGNSNYKPAEARSTIEVVRGTQRISVFMPDREFKAGDVYFMTGQSSSGLPITYTSTPPGIAVVEGGYLHLLAQGTTTITATQAGDSRYYPAVQASWNITVGPAVSSGVGNTISFSDIPEKSIVDPPFNLVASATSGLPVTFISSNPNVAEVNGNLVTIKSLGTTTITAMQGGNDSIPPATPVIRQLRIGKKQQSVSFYISSEVFGFEPLVLPKTSTAGLPITYTVLDTSFASIKDNRLIMKRAGSFLIEASQPGNKFYEPAQRVVQGFQVYPKNDQIYIKPIGEFQYGDSSFKLEAWSITGAPVTFYSSNENILSISGSTASIKGAGTVKVTATINHPGFVKINDEVNIAIRKAKQAVTFAPIESKKFGDLPFLLSASSSSGLPVTFLTSTPDVVRINGNRATILGTGSAEISAIQGGDANYESSEAVSHRFEVEEAGNIYELVGTVTDGGPNHSGAIFSVNSEGTQFGYLKNFAPRTAPRPFGGFTPGTDGKLYGVFREGGTGNAGSVVKLEADGSGFTYLHHFNAVEGKRPHGALIQGSDGFLYGTTEAGGKFSLGTIFKIKSDGTDFEVIFHFHALTGQHPENIVQAKDGKLYGITQSGGFHNRGTIFSINPDGTEFSIIFHANDNEPTKSGYSPGGLVIGPDESLYGVYQYGGDRKYGTVFKLAKDGSGFTKIHSFDPEEGDYYWPGYQITFCSDGRIYGMAAGGGIDNKGIIYGMDADGSNFVLLHSFEDTATDSLPPGSIPFGKLIEGSDGYLYGTTATGGTHNLGTIFRIRKDGSEFEILADLDEAASFPYYGPLVESSPGVFIGMTSAGRSMNGGAIFKYTADGFTTVNDLPQEPTAPSKLIPDASGEFYYGITKYGIDGVSIFKVNAAGTFSEEIYVMPRGAAITSILFASTNHLWVSGHANSEHFLFRIKPDGSDREDITTYINGFSQKRYAVISMVETEDGEIYGVTDAPYPQKPVFFKIKNDGTHFSKLAELKSNLTCDILLASDGQFYLGLYAGEIFKATRSGEISNIFVRPFPTDFPLIKEVIEVNGGRLAVAMSLTSSGTARNFGTIFTMEKDGSDYREIYPFYSREVASPVQMIQSMDGWLYVLSESGGLTRKGLIYKLRPDGSSFKKVYEFNGDDGDNPNSILFQKNTQSFSFEALTEKKVSDPAFFPSVTSSSKAPVILSSSNPKVAVVENGKIKPTGVGTTTIVATLPENANYYFGGHKEHILVVTKGYQTISFEQLPQLRIEDTYELNATSTSGLPVIYTSSDSEIASINGSTITILGSGTVTIKASQPGNENYFAAADVMQEITIAQAHEIRFSNPGDKVFGDPGFHLDATSSYGLQVSFFTTSDNILITGKEVTILKPGRVTIVALQEGNGKVEAADPVTISFCVNPAKPVITESGLVPELTLSSSNEIGNEWFFNEEIIGYDQSIFADEVGIYSVITTIDGCSSERSEAKNLITTAIEEADRGIVVFPNPTTGWLYVNIPKKTFGTARVELLDVRGKILETRDVMPYAVESFDLKDVGNGLIIIKVILHDTTVIKKVFRY